MVRNEICCRWNRRAAGRRRGWVVLGAVLALFVPVAIARAGNDPNECDSPGDEPDLIVSDLYNHLRYGAVGDITAFSVGTVACNVGSCQVNWIDGTNQHPVIGVNMFRLRDGRFEQVGQSWLKHGFVASDGDLCSTECVETDNQHLGVNCSDTYGATFNGLQTRLGPKFEVNAHTGFHPHPVTDMDLTGDAIYKRLQVHNDDLDPALNPGALFFVEGQYVTEDDAAAGNQNNNASYRPIDVFGSGGVFDFDLIGEIQIEEPAISAWAANDPGVSRVDVDVSGDGRLIVGAKAVDLGAGMWRYEYAVQNLNSNRSAGSFSVPIPSIANVSNVGFHDVDYHSGEPWDGTDWGHTVGSDSVVWQTQAFLDNPNANALRWGTLYNFRFDTNVSPVAGEATLGLFVPGTPGEVQVSTIIPLPCDNDGTCEAGEECDCPGECPVDGPDNDGDSIGFCLDCDDDNDQVWDTPGEVVDLVLQDGPSGTVLSWSPPSAPGATGLAYETIRTRDMADYVTGTICLAAADPSDTTVADLQDPPPGGLFGYLVRATNACPQGVGPLGETSASEPRIGRSCR